MEPKVDYIYWAFSAAAQSISAFVALLITGYTLVHMMMDSAQEKDDSLVEVHASLQKKYHQQITVLAWLTGLAIVCSLLVAYFNRPEYPVPEWVQLIVAAVDASAIAGGLYLVVSMVNPEKYRNAAKAALRQESAATLNSSPASTFFDAFLHLERLVRDKLKDRDLYVPSKGVSRMSYSFRQMIQALYNNEIIEHELYEELLEINKYRNLVFHGHVDKVDSNMVTRTTSASEKMSYLNQ